jgi:uncharacterized surface protein with fasciclin (FAS1) repeats
VSEIINKSYDADHIIDGNGIILLPKKSSYMKTSYKYLIILGTVGLFSCTSETNEKAPEANNATATTTEAPAAGQSAVNDPTSQPNIVQTAMASKDHSTLVTAVKAAGLVDDLSNAGPFTVFAPTNAAFDKLPKGTVEGLLKPEKKEDLRNILEYHTYVGGLKLEYLRDGQELEMVNAGKVKITKKGDKTFVNGSEIVATVPTSNGVIFVINDVLLPK